MPWWSIRYLTTGGVYNSDMVPFKLLPDIQEVSMDCGHRFSKNDMIIDVMGRIRLEMHTGGIWVDDVLVAGVKNVSRLILHKRNFESTHGGPSNQHIHAGLVDSEGQGYLVRLTETNEIYIERCMVGVRV